VRFVDEIMLRGDGMKDLIVGEYPRTVPRDNDEEMEAWVHERVSSGYHPCGTCRIGTSIEHGVVDARLQVYGVKNLRVIDASVFPLIPDARIQNPVYMVAEKGTDMIKQDHPALYEGLADTMGEGLKNKVNGLVASGVGYADTGRSGVMSGVEAIQKGVEKMMVGDKNGQ
jgi:choline dehydrogenase